ncbi:MAG: hypothetical protein H0U79_00550 [Solirubrobacterales bacterium]|nr:hypothetical protein [Solirubrobacterales bacterium]
MPRVIALPRRRPRRADPADLERELLRRSVDALRGGGPRCAGCGRNPLVGESVHVHAEGVRLCELCSALRPDAPARSELVRHDPSGQAVRLLRTG